MCEACCLRVRGVLSPCERRAVVRRVCPRARRFYFPAAKTCPLSTRALETVTSLHVCPASLEHIIHPPAPLRDTSSTPRARSPLPP
eukprot:353295-Chlamydomonas_euryale.AAC.8